jgi:hypothetical protein
MGVIPHPKRSGFWTIHIGDHILGVYDSREDAARVMLRYAYDALREEAALAKYKLGPHL